MNFMYFYDSSIDDCSMNNNTLKIDNFFRNKYDLNKKYTKIDISKHKQATKNYNLLYVPCFIVYTKNKTKETTISLLENKFMNEIEKYYNIV